MRPLGNYGQEKSCEGELFLIKLALIPERQLFRSSATMSALRPAQGGRLRFYGGVDHPLTHEENENVLLQNISSTVINA